MRRPSVVAEVALAVVLVAGAGLAMLSFALAARRRSRLHTDGVLTVAFALPDGRYHKEEARKAFYRGVRRDRGAARGGRTGAAKVTPLTGNNWGGPLRRVDRPLAPGASAPKSAGSSRRPAISARCRSRCAPAACSKPEMPGDRRGGRQPGRRSALPRRDRPRPFVDLGDQQAEIVGIVGSIRRIPRRRARAELYFPFERVGTPPMTVFIRTTGDPLSALPAVRAAVRRVEPQTVLHETRTMSAIAEESAAATRLATRLLGGFASSPWCSRRSGSTA